MTKRAIRPTARSTSERIIDQRSAPLAIEPIPSVARVWSTPTDLGMHRRTQIQFKAADLLEHLARRTTSATNASAIARRDLRRYYEILGAALLELDEQDWTPEIWRRLREALAGSVLDAPKQLRAMWAFAAQAFGDDHPVTRYLRTAPLAVLYVVVDQLESDAPDVGGHPLPSSSGMAMDSAGEQPT
jgi:hypothetical protein